MRLAIQVLGTRAVGEGAARAGGACGLNKLVPMKRSEEWKAIVRSGEGGVDSEEWDDRAEWIGRCG